MLNMGWRWPDIMTKTVDFHRSLQWFQSHHEIWPSKSWPLCALKDQAGTGQVVLFLCGSKNKLHLKIFYEIEIWSMILYITQTYDILQYDITYDITWYSGYSQTLLLVEWKPSRFFVCFDPRQELMPISGLSCRGTRMVLVSPLARPSNAGKFENS